MGDTRTHQLFNLGRKMFGKIKYIKCPAFNNEPIFLNSKCLQHLIYKRRQSARNIFDAEQRIKLIPRALELLKKTTVFQENDNCNFGNKIHKFWGFTGVIENKRITVVVRQIGENGQKHLFSIMPKWKRDRFGGIKNASGELHSK